MEVKVIYGAPASGKTTYVQQHIKDNDLIYDFDSIMQSLSGLPMQQGNDNLVGLVTDIRNLIIKSIHSSIHIDTVYFITTFLTDELLKAFDGLSVEVIKMEASMHECIERINQSKRLNKLELKKVVRDWYQKYDAPNFDTRYKNEKDKKLFYCSPKWEKLRLVALKRDNYECQECKRQGRVTVDSKKIEGEKKKVRMNVHHIKELEDYPELALDLENLESLCIRCHNSIHGKVFKVNRKEKEWQDEWW